LEYIENILKREREDLNSEKEGKAIEKEMLVKHIKLLC